MTFAVGAVLTLLALWAGLFAGHVFVLVVAAARKNSTPATPGAEKPHRFAIVVPAHNESLVIESCIDSLLAIDYPKELFTILVLADNCTDDTAALAARKGVEVRERHDAGKRGKGYALSDAFEFLLNRKPRHDALVVIDADTRVSANLLSVFNAGLNRGDQAIQCRQVTRNWDENWLTRLAELRFALFSHVLPLGRGNMGLSADLTGNGMCFARDVLTAVPWSAFSITEDVEYGRKLLMQGIPVRYAAEAVVASQTPVSLEQAKSQRQRCEFGRLEVFKKYFFPLLRGGNPRESVSAVLDLSLPSFSAFISLWVFGTAGSFAAAFGWGGPSLWVLCAIWLTLGLVMGVSVVSALALAGLPRRASFSLAYLPFYVLWKNLILLAGLFGPNRKNWVRTERAPISAKQAVAIRKNPSFAAVRPLTKQKERPIRVAAYYPWVYLTSGVERTILEICRRSRHEYTVFTNHFDAENTFPGFQDLNVQTLAPVPVERDMRSVLKAATVILSQKVDFSSYDVVVVHCDGLGDLLLAHRHPVPVVCFCHTPLRPVFDLHYRRQILDHFRGPRRLAFEAFCAGFRRVDQRMWSRYRYAFFNSSETRARAEQGGLLQSLEGRHEVLHPGVDWHSFAPTWRYEPYFLVPGRIMWTKNIETAVRAFQMFKAIRPENSGFRLVVAGQVDKKSQQYLQRLKEMANGAADIEYVVCPSDEALRDLYANCYAVLFPPFNEDWGIVPLEANSFGKPVIASNRGGPRESQKDGETGFLVEPEPLAFARAMARLACQESLTRRLGFEGRLHARAFDWDEFVTRNDVVLESLLNLGEHLDAGQGSQSLSGSRGASSPKALAASATSMVK